MLTEKQIEEFQEIYKKIYGRDISKENAYKQGIKIVNLFELIINNLNGREFR